MSTVVGYPMRRIAKIMPDRSTAPGKCRDLLALVPEFGTGSAAPRDRSASARAEALSIAGRPPWPDLEGRCPPQAAGRLEPERHARARAGDLGEIAGGQFAGLADVGDVAPIGNAVDVIPLGDDVGLGDLLRRPAQARKGPPAFRGRMALGADCSAKGGA